MHVTSNKIATWASSVAARSLLPGLLRKLIHAQGMPRHIDFPAGSSTDLPGWDGTLETEHGNAWVPVGKSHWEVSCKAHSTAKANDDYIKRTKATPRKERAGATLVVVTARRWSTKAGWASAKQAQGDWADVRAYDASDLEQWLERCPAVALSFADHLGLSGEGVESLEKAWSVWADQSDPVITVDAILVGRNSSEEQILSLAKNSVRGGKKEPLALYADSAEEAGAFACAVLQKSPDLAACSLVVTSEPGWRFVEKNPSIQTVIVANADAAARPLRRENLTVFLACPTGGIVSASREDTPSNSVIIQRPPISDFAKAIALLGVEEGKSERIAAEAGRSWSTLRRLISRNPVIRKPAWQECPQADVLTTLCLVGQWNERSESECALVATISGRSYDQVEKDLKTLVNKDDSPVLKIGEEWRAKAPVDLLQTQGPRIGRGELDRYFLSAEEVLAEQDPQLELSGEERSLASFRGVKRKYSDGMRGVLCEGLAKIAVWGPEIPALQGLDVEDRASSLVRTLLHSADATRWLSLAPELPMLAEAAPESFLAAAEHSLKTSPSPMLSLFSATEPTGTLFGRCWHSGLLWALETLAWEERYLARVARVLAQCCNVEIKGNWGNTPIATLMGIFRSWYPQTLANLEHRLEVLDLLIDRYPEVSFSLLKQLANTGHDVAHPTHRPKWKNLGIPAKPKVTNAEVHQMVLAAFDRLLVLAKGKAKRISEVISISEHFALVRKEQIQEVIDDFVRSCPADEDRELVRGKIRSRVYWLINYGEEKADKQVGWSKYLKGVYERLEPHNLLARHRWLFADHWVELPIRVRNEEGNRRGELLQKARISALREIYKSLGMDGVEQLISTCGGSHSVGFTIKHLRIALRTLAKWVATQEYDLESNGNIVRAIEGFLAAMPVENANKLVQEVVECSRREKWENVRLAMFLTLCPPRRQTWETAKGIGKAVEDTYWKTARIDVLYDSESQDGEYALRRLLEAGRPYAAFSVCEYMINKVPPALIAEIMEQMLRGSDEDKIKHQAWHLKEIFELFEQSGSIPREQLLRLEFHFFKWLGGSEQIASTLFEEVTTHPGFFTELICLCFKPRHRDEEDAPDERLKHLAEIAYDVLHYCKRIPGLQTGGGIDEARLTKFVDEARELCAQADRAEACDHTLGPLFAHSPPDPDGTWPCKAVRDLLERPDLEDLRKKLYFGIVNMRGVYSKSLKEGGAQELELAKKYDGYASAIRNTNPAVASVLDDVVRSYRRDAEREDFEALRRTEEY